MNEFLRKLAALGVLTSLCELLAPEGGMRRIARLTIGLMTTALLLSALLSLKQGLMGGASPSVETAMFTSFEAASAQDEERYRQVSLQARANQVKVVCEQLLRAAGYQGTATVLVAQDGGISSIQLDATAEAPLVSADELSARIADTFALGRQQVTP